MTTIFVYGTLMRGECRHVHLARDGSAYLGKGRTACAYVLYQEDGANYPCMVLEERGVAVLGELWEVSDETLLLLDEVEGVPRWFQRQTITLDDGRRVQAYLMAQRPTQARRLGGQWRTETV